MNNEETKEEEVEVAVYFVPVLIVRTKDRRLVELEVMDPVLRRVLNQLARQAAGDVMRVLQRIGPVTSPAIARTFRQGIEDGRIRILEATTGEEGD